MKKIQLLLLMLTASYCSIAQDSMPKKRFIQQTKKIYAYINQKNELIVLLKNSGKQLLQQDLMQYDAGAEIEDTVNGIPYYFSDINCDGYKDLLFRSVSGNVQRMASVYIFNPIKNSLEYNQDLSEIPCISVNNKTKTISGTCFHASAAENWNETYQWQNGKLILIEKKGTMPCKPTEDCYYIYKQKLVKGKLVYIYRNKIKN